MPEASRVLVVEDEESIRRGLCDVLVFRGYAVEWCGDGERALELVQREDFALIILDVMLPNQDGFTVCRALRSVGKRSAVLMLTAKGSEDDLLAGFAAGADDYVIKPFSVRELLARVEALVRRVGVRPDRSFQAGPLHVDPTRSLATGSSGTAVELSAREVQILALLARDQGRIVSRSLLLREAWGVSDPERIETRTVDVHIAKLRKKLGRDGDALETVRGQGYRLCSSP
ncbi:MAG TPA: response regulator transcription factor [Polyangiales bacterium]